MGQGQELEARSCMCRMSPGGGQEVGLAREYLLRKLAGLGAAGRGDGSCLVDELVLTVFWHIGF